MKQNHLLLSGLFLVLVGIVIFLKFETQTIDYDIKPCDKNLGGNAISIEATGSSIKFHQTLNSYCNTNKDNLKITYAKQGNQIQVIETFSAKAVTKCICPFEISGEIPNLEKGDYEISFIFNNRYAGQKDVLGSELVEVV